jgi:ribosomal protein L15E
MAAALEQVAGPAAASLIDWRPDPSIARIITSWPARMDSARARALGLVADADFETIVRDYVRENPDAVKAALS